MMTPHNTRDVSTLKGHPAPMKSLCDYRTFGGGAGGWGWGQDLNSPEADSGAGYQGSGGAIAELQTLESEREEAGGCHRQAAGWRQAPLSSGCCLPRWT